MSTEKVTKINETPTWVKDIYRIQTNDYILGGTDGAINIQPHQIANRTLYLLNLIRTEHDAEGKHHITGSQISIADDDKIDASKASLDVPFETLRAMLDTANASVAKIQDVVDYILGRDGYKTTATIRAQKFVWEYGTFCFNWEMFNDEFSTSDYCYKDVDRTGHNDDTIMFSETESNEDIELGRPYIVWSADDFSDSEVVVPKLKIDNGWIRTINDITLSRQNAHLASSNWEYYTNYAISKPNSTYISNRIVNLHEAPSSKLTINMDSGSGSFKVLFYNDSGVCTTCELEKTETLTDGTIEDTFILPSDYGYYVVTNTSNEDIKVNWLVSYPQLPINIIEPIKKPDLESPKDTIKRNELFTNFDEFRTAYQDNHAYTKYCFKDDYGSSVVEYVVMDKTLGSDQVYYVYDSVTDTVVYDKSHPVLVDLTDNPQIVYVSKRTDDLLEGTYTVKIDDTIVFPVLDDATDEYVYDTETGIAIDYTLYKITLYRPDGTRYHISGIKPYKVLDDGTITDASVLDDSTAEEVLVDMESDDVDIYTSDPTTLPEINVYKYDSDYIETLDLYHITVYEDDAKTIIKKSYYSKYADGRTEDYYFTAAVDPNTTYTNIIVYDGSGTKLANYSEETALKYVHIPMREAPKEGKYYVKCQHGSDFGDISRWSEEFPVVITKFDSTSESDTGGYFGFDGNSGVYNSQPGSFDDPEYGKFWSIHYN